MKKIILLLYSVSVTVGLFAQVPAGIRFTSEKSIAYMKRNVEFVVDSISYDPTFRPLGASPSVPASYYISTTQAGTHYTINAVDLPKELKLKPVDDNIQNYWFAKNLESLKVISEFSNLYARRADIEEDSNEYIRMLNKYDLIFDDPFLTSYLYSVVSKIVPNKRADGFPYDIRIFIIKDPSMNVSVFPNGTMLINTGLLSVVHTEDELVAALAHEIGHFVANHTLVNIRKMEKAQARAEFWGGLAVAAVAATTISAASHGYYYSNSSVYDAAILSYSIASSVLKRVGMDYSRKQEEEADKMALDALKYLGYNQNALADLFQRMADAYNSEGNWAAYYLAGDHPSLAKRISYSGKPNPQVNPDFERIVSFAVSNAAITKYNEGRFSQAIKYANQNILNRVGTDDDYLIKALCLINLYNDTTHNTEAALMIQEAKSINPSNSNILRTEIIVSLRNKEYSKAKTLIESYIASLNDGLASILDGNSPRHDFLLEEINWARKMAIKVKGL